MESNADESLIPANILLISNSGKSVINNRYIINHQNVKDFLPSKKVIEEAKIQLEQLGFTIDIVAKTHISIFGTKNLFENVFNIHLIEKTSISFQLNDKNKSKKHYFEIDKNKPPEIPPQLVGLIEDIVFPTPPIYHIISASPPSVSYDHLKVPHDIERDMDAKKVHQRGHTGKGVTIAMVDTGFMTPYHPYYLPRSYDIKPVIADPTDPNPLIDSQGHGTAISACLLAVAPEVTLIPVKIKDNPASMFTKAVNESPSIITCSWELEKFDPSFQLIINNAVADGIVVIFSCGNEGAVGWPGSEPSVISVGGTYIDSSDNISASSFSSSGININNPQRQCPDVCGLAGNSPYGIYIMVPTQPNSDLDKILSNTCHDETLPNDGWIVASGTSTAAPMVAAVVSLLMNVDPSFVGNPIQVKNRLISTCLDVECGISASGERATEGVDPATGNGLIQAYLTCYQMDLWIKNNNTSDIGLIPVIGRRPSFPPHTHWTSPDIKVFSKPLDDPSLGFDNSEDPIILGQSSFVYVKVRNRGSIANKSSATLKLYYADPCTYLTYPDDWYLIDTKTVSANEILPNSDLVFPDPFVWNPPDPFTVDKSHILSDGGKSGHFCLLAVIGSTEDPVIGEKAGISDNNMGMKNILFLQGHPRKKFIYKFFINGSNKKNPHSATQNDLLIDLSAVPNECNLELKTTDGFLNPKELKNAKIENEDTIVLLHRYDSSFIGNFTLKSNERKMIFLTIKFSELVSEGDYIISIQQISDGVQVGGIDLKALVYNH